MEPVLSFFLELLFSLRFELMLSIFLGAVLLSDGDDALLVHGTAVLFEDEADSQLLVPPMDGAEALFWNCSP